MTTLANADLAQLQRVHDEVMDASRRVSAGRNVAANLRRLRDARGITVRELAGLLDAIGHSTLPSAITKIENRQRKVDVDDLVALAEVLAVSPMALLASQGEQASAKRRNSFTAAVYRLATEKGLSARELLAELTKEAAALAATLADEEILGIAEIDHG